MPRPELWIVRHGETEWSLTGRHTSHTDVRLTTTGEDQARRMAWALAGVRFDLVLSSPLQRSRQTAALLGLPDVAREPALAEWDYGEYEGLTTEEIRRTDPGWSVWTHPSPGGESADEVRARADWVIRRVVTEATDRVLVVSHGHFLRVLAARWMDQPATVGMHLLLDVATLSVLGWEREVRAIRTWNLHPSPGATGGETGGGPAAGPS